MIGDEILSGRTKDRNIGYIADFLTAMGIDLKEARVVSDDQPEIVAALNALRDRYTYVFTTGGIGPTHDDITADAVAAAFGVGIGEDERAMKIMLERYKPEDLTPARRRMTRIPHGAELVDNPVSKAPGFRIGNVIVMAGVPQIMQAMLDSAAKGLQRRREDAFAHDRGVRSRRGATATRSPKSPRSMARSSSARILPSPTASSATRSSCADATPARSTPRLRPFRRCWKG